MEQPQNIKTVSALVIILLVVGIGYILFTFFAKPRPSNNQENAPVTLNDINDNSVAVTVENTPMSNGTLPPPAGFPKDIPLEYSGLMESATTRYPKENARQLSLSYQSAKTVAQKYTEYKDYMKRAGYQVTEGGAGSPVRAIFGAKDGANLSVAISGAEGKTLVQISYLVK